MSCFHQNGSGCSECFRISANFQNAIASRNLELIIAGLYSDLTTGEELCVSVDGTLKSYFPPMPKSTKDRKHGQVYLDKNGKKRKVSGKKQYLCCQRANCTTNASYGQFCGPCAKKEGTHERRHPCEMCGGSEAGYKNKEGKKRLCGDCAIAEGTHFASVQGASRVACECFDRLEKQLGYKLPHMHYCWDQDGKQKIVGNEKTGLIHGSRARPDSYVPEKNEVWLFHGNYYHGYPPGHPKHHATCSNDRPSDELYKATMAQMALYKKCGYSVKCIWEHEYNLTTGKVPKQLMGVVRSY